MFVQILLLNAIGYFQGYFVIYCGLILTKMSKVGEKTTEVFLLHLDQIL